MCPSNLEMSGLGSHHRRLASPLGLQALVQGMIRPRRERAPGQKNRCTCRGLHRPRWDRVKAEHLPLVHDPHGPIHMLFHQDVGSPDRLVNLIQSTLIGNREVLSANSGSS